MSSQYDSEADQIIENARQMIQHLNKLLEKAGAPVRAKMEKIDPPKDEPGPQSPPA